MAIVKPTMLGTTERMNFAKINEVLEMPNLLEVQKNSYKWFIEEGIKEVFRDKLAAQRIAGHQHGFAEIAGLGSDVGSRCS